MAIARAMLGTLATAQRDFGAAYQHLALSLTTAQESGDPGDVAFVLDAFAWLAVAQGQARRALRLAGAAAAARDQTATRLAPTVRQRLDEKLRPAREALGSAADGALGQSDVARGSDSRCARECPANVDGDECSQRRPAQQTRARSCNIDRQRRHES